MKAIVVENRLWGNNLGFMTLKAPEFAEKYRPGQMCMVSVSSAYSKDPLLNRPFAPCNIDVVDGTISIIYAVVGRGTSILSEKHVNDVIELTMPRGNFFTIKPNNNVALIAGGVGIAPMMALADKLIENNCNVTMYYGGRSSEYIFPVNDVKYLQKICTDDGSLGFNGFNTDLFKNDLEKSVNFDFCYTCGPYPMMKTAFNICSKYKLPLEVSLESKMACGVGVCSGCMVNIKENDTTVMKRCCTEGPIFDGYKVQW